MKVRATTLPDGMKVIQPEDSLGINYEIYDCEAYTKYRDIAEGDIVVDIGAHVGIFTVKAASKAKTVIAIEPDPINYSLLVSNIERNNLKNVSTLNVAVSDFNGKARLHVGSASVFPTLTPELISLEHHARRKYDRYVMVKVRTLDELLKETDLSRVDFMKIDVEGAELQVLKGARETIKNNSKVYLALAAEHYELQPLDVLDYLHYRGFACKMSYVESQHSWHIYGSRDP